MQVQDLPYRVHLHMALVQGLREFCPHLCDHWGFVPDPDVAKSNVPRSKYPVDLSYHYADVKEAYCEECRASIAVSVAEAHKRHRYVAVEIRKELWDEEVRK